MGLVAINLAELADFPHTAFTMDALWVLYWREPDVDSQLCQLVTPYRTCKLSTIVTQNVLWLYYV
jgi:hypothetical protein